MILAFEMFYIPIWIILLTAFLTIESSIKKSTVRKQIEKYLFCPSLFCFATQNYDYFKKPLIWLLFYRTTMKRIKHIMQTLKLPFGYFYLSFYTYIAYGILLYAIIKIRRFLRLEKSNNRPLLWTRCDAITAYNEKDCAATKCKTPSNLNILKKKLNVIWVTDGSDDGHQIY
jgi:hypothetical protein